MIANPAEVWSRSRGDYRPCHAVLAATNKCLAQSNKSGTGGKATKKCEWLVDGPEYTNKPCDLDHRQRLTLATMKTDRASSRLFTCGNDV
jgi:hypothetical protein